MAYRSNNGKDIITVFSRQTLRPEVDETGRGKPVDVPQQIYFVLPDSTVLKLPTQQDLILGRRPRQRDPETMVDLEAHDGRALGVSRQHALIKVMNGALLLVDLDSINGTFINEERALPTKRYVLMDGDTIRCGKLSMQLHFQQP